MDPEAVFAERVCVADRDDVVERVCGSDKLSVSEVDRVGGIDGVGDRDKDALRDSVGQDVVRVSESDSDRLSLVVGSCVDVTVSDVLGLRLSDSESVRVSSTEVERLPVSVGLGDVV